MSKGSDDQVKQTCFRQSQVGICYTMQAECSYNSLLLYCSARSFFSRSRQCISTISSSVSLDHFRYLFAVAFLRAAFRSGHLNRGSTVTRGEGAGSFAMSFMSLQRPICNLIKVLTPSSTAALWQLLAATGSTRARSDVIQACREQRNVRMRSLAYVTGEFA